MNPNNLFSDSRWVSGAQRHLSKTDRSLAKMIDHVGPFRPGLIKNTFQALTFSIIHQQLSMKAAATIRGRVISLCKDSRLTVENMLRLTTGQLRKAGMSGQKVSYVKSICEHFQNGALKPAKLKRMSNEEVIEVLIDIRGVGRWTAEMILIFNLQRPDVWPVDDLGLRIALHKWYGIPKTAKRDKLIAAGEKFRPYRSVATWYLWSSLNTGIVPGFKS